MAGVMRSYRMIAVLTAVISGLVTIAFTRLPQLHLGFDTSVPGAGFGLVSMRERIRSVGGELHIRSGPGRGSEVEVAV